MLQFLHNLFSTQGYLPSSQAVKLPTEIVWISNFSDYLIWVVFTAMSMMVIYIVTNSPTKLPKVLYFFFASLFLVGITHFMSATTYFLPTYGLLSLSKLIAACVCWLALVFSSPYIIFSSMRTNVILGKINEFEAKIESLEQSIHRNADSMTKMRDVLDTYINKEEGGVRRLVNYE